MSSFKRPAYRILARRLRERRHFLQVLTGPRQTGKTTLARQVLKAARIPSHYASADEPTLKDRIWIEQQWEVARAKGLSGRRLRKSLLVLDEIQKIEDWSETVKRLWDEDTHHGRPLRVILLGSSTWLVQAGLTESLAGRFEVIPVTHWSFAEMRSAFGWNLEHYVHHGGYPGAVDLTADPGRWLSYIMSSLVETTISRDIMLMTRVNKPALLRRLFALGCAYSGRILSYQKMQGQLRDAGNTTTLAHYLDLLESAGLLMGLQKYAGEQVRQRASSPKLQVLNTALMTASSGRSLDDARSDPEYWGRLVESAVGAHLANGLWGTGATLHYWRDRNREVDFVIRGGRRLVTIEVKTSRRKTELPGVAAFDSSFGASRKLLVGPHGLDLESFFLTPPARWLE